MASNYLTLVSVYALLLLSDMLFWNILGFDRAAAQIYFLTPVRLSTVLAAKNIAAMIFVILEIALIASVCTLLRLPMSALKLLEACSVTLVLALFMFAIGNVTSTRYPRAMDPSRTFRSVNRGSAMGKMVLAFPVALAPIALAFLARYAFASELAFFGVMLAAGLLGIAVYRVATQSAVETAERQREQLISALSQGEGPIAG
jgi:hypothetical protein